VPADAEFDNIEASWLPVLSIVRRVEHMATVRKGVILAMCHNGREKSVLSTALQSELASLKGVPSLFDRSEAMIVTSAASWGETARKDVGLGHDVYTWYLLEALQRGR
jgi:hypothetical protein